MNQPEAVPIYLGLGSNLGDRAGNLRRAIELLTPGCGSLVASSVYETPPWGDLDQASFLNLVARGETRLIPMDLLRKLKEVEVAAGRTPTRHWGPRVLDVDILSYGDQVVTQPDLEIPHPRLQDRGFVLVPLAELSPEWRHPVLGKTAADLLAKLPKSETAGIRRWGVL